MSTINTHALSAKSGGDHGRTGFILHGRLLIAFCYLSALSLFVHQFEMNELGLSLVPLPLLLYRFELRVALMVYMGCILLFFEAFRMNSNLHFLFVQDSVLVVFMILLVTFPRKAWVVTIPRSRTLSWMYLFCGYALALSVWPLIDMGFDEHLLRDVKNILCLLLVVVIRHDPLLDARKLVQFLLLVVFATAAYAALCTLDFAVNRERIITWNEVYFSDGLIVALVLLRQIKSPPVRKALKTAAVFCGIGILITQTRGIWLSTLASLAVFAHFGKGGIRQVLTFRRMAPVILIIGFGFVFARLTAGGGVVGFVQGRMGAYSENELSTPLTSMGFRVYESYQVWRERSVLGHGSGARIRLYNPFYDPTKMIDWWSIHSEYFEILHKYGYVGLLLFAGFLLSFLKKSWRIAKRGSSIRRIFGQIGFLVILNHCIVSITSGYLVRVHVMVFFAVLVGMIERYGAESEPANQGRGD